MVHLFGKSKQSTGDRSLIQGKVHCFHKAVCDTLFILLKGILNTLQNQQKFTAEMLSVPCWAEIIAEESNWLDCREWLRRIGQIQAVERNTIILIWERNNNAQQEVSFLNQLKQNKWKTSWVGWNMWFFKNINTFENFLISIKSKKNIWDANKRMWLHTQETLQRYM